MSLPPAGTSKESKHPLAPGDDLMDDLATVSTAAMDIVTDASSNMTGSGEYVDVKVALSLYRVQQSIYLLDFQRIEGDAFGFMKTCAMIITELKNLSAASRAMQLQRHQAQLTPQPRGADAGVGAST